jgi:hypothetical protein
MPDSHPTLDSVSHHFARGHAELAGASDRFQSDLHGCRRRCYEPVAFGPRRPRDFPAAGGDVSARLTAFSTRAESDIYWLPGVVSRLERVVPNW